MKIRNHQNYFLKNKKLLKLILIIDTFGDIIFKPRKIDFNFKPEKVIISNVGHLGDILLSLKTIDVIKNRNPDSKIYFLCSSWAYPLVKNHPLIEDIIIYDPFFLNSSDKFLLKFFKSLYFFIRAFLKIRKISPDIAFDLRASFPNTLMLLRLGGSKFIAGYGTVGFGFLCDKLIEWKEGKHEIEHYLDVLRCICDINKDEIKRAIDLSYLTNNIDERILFEKIGIDMNEKFLIFHICSRDRRKMIDIKEWLKLFDYCSSKYKIVFTGTQDEFEYINKYFGSKYNALNVAGKLNLGELIFLIKKSFFIITLDSFVGQLVGVLNLNSIVIFSGGVDVKRFGPLGEKSYALRKNISCSPCLWYRRKDCRYECMDLDILEKFIEVEKNIE